MYKERQIIMIIEEEFKNVALPEKWQRLSLNETKKLCSEMGLENVRQKIEIDPPGREFYSDGASMCPDCWFGTNLYPLAVRHDLHYWAGRYGEVDARRKADLELVLDVKREGHQILAFLMRLLLRVFGSGFWPFPWRWGYGRHYWLRSLFK